MTQSKKIQAGELFVRISADYADFVKGIDKSNDELDELERASDKASGEVKDLNRQFDGAADSAQAYQRAVDKVVDSGSDASRTMGDLTSEISRTDSEIQDLIDEVRKINQHLDTMADNASEAADQTGKLGDKSDDSKGKVGGMLSSIKGAITPVTAALALVSGAVLGIGTAAVDASNTALDAMRTIAYETGAAGDELERYADIAKDISLSGSYTREDAASATAKVKTLNKMSEDDPMLEELTTEYLALIDMHPEASIKDIDTAFKKWGVSTDEQIEYLRAFNSISQSTGVDIATLTSLLADGDRAFQMMGMSMMEAAAYIGEADWAGEVDDVAALTNAIERLQAQKAAALGSDEEASEYIANLTKTVKAMKDESEAIAYLTSEEVGLDVRTAQSFAASMFSSAEDISATLEEVEKDVETSLADIVKEYETAGDVLNRIGRNIAAQFEETGESIKENWLKPIDEFMQIVNSEGWERAWDEADAYILRQTDPAYYQRLREEAGVYGNTANITINQTLNSPEPLSGAVVEQAAEHGVKKASKSVFT